MHFVEAKTILTKTNGVDLYRGCTKYIIKREGLLLCLPFNSFKLHFYT